MATPHVFRGNVPLADDTLHLLSDARSLASQHGSSAVTAEHLLVAALSSDSAAVGQIARGIVPDSVALAEDLAAALPRSTVGIEAADLPHGPGSKAMMVAAVGLASETGAARVEPVHLFIAALEASGGTAAATLRRHGVRTADARLLLDASEQTAFALRVDDESPVTIYQQIEVQVKEAVATGRLQAGDRLPPVRQVAEALDIAPGTVARAYRGLEQEGIVVTEGARGTRIAGTRPASAAGADPGELVPLLRSAAVAAYHRGFGAGDLRRALDMAMQGLFRQ